MKNGSKDKPKPKPAEGPRCPICGRRNTVRKLEPRVYHCDHCQKMFQG